MDSKRKVLVVDDQDSFREAVAFEFEMLGYETVLAENGEKAFEALTPSGPFDLIISDIRMPKWDGKKFLNELRKVSKQSPPFIFMTGFADLNLYDAFNEGANAFVGKPIEPSKLEDVIQDVMKPRGERWLTIPQEEVARQIQGEVSDSGHFQLGSEGFFLAMDCDSTLSESKVGDIIRFDLDLSAFGVVSLMGFGRIIWTRPEDIEGLTPGVGIRFEYLDPDCRAQVFANIDENQGVATIPRGDSLFSVAKK